MKKITNFIIGHGSAGKAVAKSLEILKIIHPDLAIGIPRFLPRGQKLDSLDLNREEISVLSVCGPHGTHAKTIIEADATGGFDLILVEKPACVTLSECDDLKKIKTPTFVFHGYRHMWGPQLLKTMLDGGEFGEIISIEGRYWQSSSAQKALAEKSDKSSWKNNISLSGPHDVLLDLGCHWTDMVFFLKGKSPVRSNGFLSYVNSEAAHRDTHVHLSFEFDDKSRAFASISKTFHGKGNHFEINILGAKKAATWCFENPDELIVSQGVETKIIRRTTTSLGSMQAPFHGVGWLEGHLEIIYKALLSATNQEKVSLPTLSENIEVVRTLLTTEF